MIEHSLLESKFDSCVYHKLLSNSSSIYQLLYVDGMLITAKSMYPSGDYEENS